MLNSIVYYDYHLPASTTTSKRTSATKRRTPGGIHPFAIMVRSPVGHSFKF